MNAIQECVEAEMLKKYIRRVFWRLQYKVRKQTNTELYILQDNTAAESFEADIISNLNVKSILDKIPSNKARYIIFRIILQGVTEKQVAYELKISQQAVHKCKTKTLQDLKKKVEILF